MKPTDQRRGYFGIALFENKSQLNVGCILRSAQAFGADFVCTIGQRYTRRVATDTANATQHLPLWHFADIDDFLKHRPRDCQLLSVEVDGTRQLETYIHPERAIYIFGGEDRSVPEELKKHSTDTLKIDTRYCLNLAVASSVVMYDRTAKQRGRR